jgi:hypothetical protein
MQMTGKLVVSSNPLDFEACAICANFSCRKNSDPAAFHPGYGQSVAQRTLRELCVLCG